jgi:hypothetical protein
MILALTVDDAKPGVVTEEPATPSRLVSLAVGEGRAAHHWQWLWLGPNQWSLRAHHGDTGATDDDRMWSVRRTAAVQHRGSRGVRSACLSQV